MLVVQALTGQARLTRQTGKDLRSAMNTGQYISGAGHLAVVGWVLVGGVLFRPEEPPFEFTTVSVISSADFNSMQEAAAPKPTETPVVEETQPVIENPTPPEPVDEVPETPPEPPEVETETDPEEPPAPPPPNPESGSIVLDEEVDNAAVRESENITDVETPDEPEIETSPTPQEATQESEEVIPETPVESVQETVREESTTEIVTEAQDQGAGEGGDDRPQVSTLAPTRSPRPQARPDRPTPAAAEPVEERPTDPPPAEEPDPAPADDPLAALINEAMEDAEAGAETTSDTGGAGLAANGPPLTGGEIEGFRLAVKQCWVIDPGSQAARISVTVGFSLDQNGKVTRGPSLVSNSPGNDAAIRTAFEAARRAVLRCGGAGFDLPPEKYNQWREVEITFDAGSGNLR